MSLDPTPGDYSSYASAEDSADKGLVLEKAAFLGTENTAASAAGAVGGGGEIGDASAAAELLAAEPARATAAAADALGFGRDSYFGRTVAERVVMEARHSHLDALRRTGLVPGSASVHSSRAEVGSAWAASGIQEAACSSAERL